MSRLLMPWEDGYRSDLPIVSGAEELAPEITATGLQEAVDGYIEQYLADVTLGKRPRPMPTVSVVTKDGQTVVVNTATRSAWRTFFTGLGFDLMAALLAVLGTVTNIDTMTKAGWTALGVLVIKTVVTTIFTYITQVKIVPTISTTQPSLLPRRRKSV
jgi:hypothetical protein